MGKGPVSMVPLVHPCMKQSFLKCLDVDENPQHEMYVLLKSKINTYLHEDGTDGKAVIYKHLLQDVAHNS